MKTISLISFLFLILLFFSTIFISCSSSKYLSVKCPDFNDNNKFEKRNAINGHSIHNLHFDFINNNSKIKSRKGSIKNDFYDENKNYKIELSDLKKDYLSTNCFNGKSRKIKITFQIIVDVSKYRLSKY